MKKKNKQTLTILITLGILLVLIFAGVFKTPGVIISVSEIQVQPEGYLEGNHIKGSYVVITGVVKYSEDWQVLEFNNETMKENPSYWNGERVWVENDIKIQFKPQRPYFSRAMEYKSQMVTPKAYKNWGNKFTGQIGTDHSEETSPMYSQHWEFAESDWQLHVPIVLEVYVNGEKIATRTLDLLDITQMELGHSLNITTGRGTLLIESLGALLGGRYPPEWGNIIYFSDKYFYVDSTAIRQALDCPYPYPDGGGDGVLDSGYETSYAYYWYGGVYNKGGVWGVVDFNRYWVEDGTPCAFQQIMPASYIGIGNDAPGWWEEVTWSDYLYHPIGPVKFPEDKWQLPEEKRGCLSLIEFLEANGAIRPSKPSWMGSWDDMLVESGYMYLALPWASFAHEITVKIPSELCDAVVEIPKLSNIKIESFPDNLGDIATDKTVNLKLKQYGNVVSEGIVEIELLEPSTAYVAFNPSWFGTGPIEPDATKDFSIQIINLGSPKNVDCRGNITVKNTYGIVTDFKEFSFSLLERQGNYSILTVKVRDEEGLPVNGLQVIVTYEGKSKAGYTSEGFVTFDFQGATPTVTVSTEETDVYASASTVHQMHEGYNEVTLTVVEKGKEQPPPSWDWMFWVLLAGVIIIIAFIVYKKRRLLLA